MVDSSYFKNNKNSSRGSKGNGKLMDRLKKHKWIPLVVLILIALAMIAIQYIMLDVLQYSRELAEQQKSAGFINIFPFIKYSMFS